MDIIVDRKTGKIIGYDIDNNQFEYKIKIDDNYELKKEVTCYSEKLKVNNLGQNLYQVDFEDDILELPENLLNGRTATPVTEKIEEKHTIIFTDNFAEFTLEDILTEKITQLTNKYGYKRCILNEIYLQDIVDLSCDKNKVDCGFKIIRIKPNGSVKLKEINLPIESEKLKVIVESDKEVNIKYSFDNVDYYDYEDSIDLKSNSIFLVIDNISEDNVVIDSISFLF